MTTQTEYPLPGQYRDGTPQDHIDALRDEADLRTDGPVLDYLALAGAALIEKQAAEIERLRAVAWKLHDGMTDQHAWADHILNDDCAGCDKAWQECESSFACDRYQQWQKAYMDALGLVIGPRPEVAR